MMRHLLCLLCLLLSASSAPADPAAGPAGFDPQRHMRVSEVRDGMKGYGLSVFRGTTIERFDVEVISVLRNFNPRYDVILVRCKGANLEHTGGIAGMSGSPVYLVDQQGHARLIGAFAYGWPMSKDPVGGIQPIEYMLAMRACAGPRTKPCHFHRKQHQPPSAPPANPSPSPATFRPCPASPPSQRRS
jgi:hypothetical protein